MKHALDARGDRAVGRGLPSPDPSALLEWSRFSVVGITGIVVNQVTLVAVTELLAVHYLVSAALATLASSTWNFALIERWAFGSRRPGTGVRDRYAGFLGLNVALLVLRIPLLWLLTEPVQVSYALSNLITLVAFFAIRLAVSHRWLWGGEHGATWQADPSPAAARIPERVRTPPGTRMTSAASSASNPPSHCVSSRTSAPTASLVPGFASASAW